jgi:hypothetical protein
MYSELKITKTGLFNGDKDVSAELMRYLKHPCALESGLLFKDILSLIEPYAPHLSNLLTGGPWLMELLDEGKKQAAPCKDIKHIEVGWSSQLQDYGDGEELEEYVNVNGAGTDGPYGLDFCAVNSLVDLEVRLNEEVVLYDWRHAAGRLAKNGPPVLYKARKRLTLLDILHGIFWELSFFGGPSTREAKAKEMCGLIDQIKSGEEKLIPWEDVKAKLDQPKDEPDADFDLGAFG